MFKRCGRSIAFGVCLFQSLSASAEGPEDEAELRLAYGDSGTISIAAGHRQSLRRAPAVASVVTAEDIAAMGATDIDQVLETVPGVHVTRASARNPSTYMIRGLGSTGQTNPQVLLMQNGIPVTTMFNGDKGAAWNGVPVENIARIEIIRGPGSALYGADAYAGVINVITKAAADIDGTEFGVRAGSFNMRDTWVQHGGEAGPFEVAAYLRLGETNGAKEWVTPKAGGAGAMNAGYDAIDGSLDVSYDKWRLRSSYKLRDEVGTGVGLGTTLDPTHKARIETLTTDLSWADPRLSDTWGAGATVSGLYYSLQYPNNVLMAPVSTDFPEGKIGGPNQWERQMRLSAFVTYTGFAGHDLRVGAGHDDLALYKARTYRNFLYNGSYTGPAITDYSNTQPHIRPQYRRVDYWYAQDEWQLAPDWALTAGVRHDKYSDFGGTTNPRVALVWQADYDLTAKLLYGRAFRAPAFNELYGINPTANGDPALRPEQIGTGEAAVSWQVRGNLELNASLFRYDSKNLIRLVNRRYANVGRQHGTGMELEAVWDPLSNLRVTVNYSSQKSVDEATDADPGYAPRQHWYARADWLWAAGWLASLQLNEVADRGRAVGDLRPAVADYNTVDLTLRTNRGRDEWDFAGTIRNLFNTKAFEPTDPAQVTGDLPLPRRSFYLEARYRL